MATLQRKSVAAAEVRTFLVLKMAMFTLQENQFIYLRGIVPIDIYPQLSETCDDSIVDVEKSAFVYATVQRRSNVI